MSRAAAGFFALASAIGFLMYLSQQDSLVVAYFTTTFVGLLLFATYPRKALAVAGFRASLLVIAVLAITVTMPMMYRDINLVNAPDYGGFILRSLECGIFALMALEPFVGTRSAV
jgi:hypothetical protein